MSVDLGDPRVPAVVAKLAERDAGPLVPVAADLVGAPALHDALLADGWHVGVIDDAPVRDKTSLLRGLYAGVRAPAYAGENWDACLDVLRDLVWLEPVAGIVLVWRDPGGLETRDAGAAATFLDVLADAAAHRVARSHPPLRVIAPVRP